MLLKQPTCGKLIHHYGDGKTKINFSNNWLQSQFRRFLVVSLLKKHTKHRTVRVCMCVSKRKKDLKKGGGGIKPLGAQMGNPRRPCTSWPPSQEVVPRAAEKSDYLLLAVSPDTVCVRACMCNVCVFIGSSHLNEERKLPNGQTGTPHSPLTFLTPYPSLPLIRHHRRCLSLQAGDGQTFPCQWQDMIGQMKINGTPWCQWSYCGLLEVQWRPPGGLSCLTDRLSGMAREREWGKWCLF